MVGDRRRRRWAGGRSTVVLTGAVRRGPLATVRWAEHWLTVAVFVVAALAVLLFSQRLNH